MNYVHLIGTICSKPTDKDFILKCGNSLVHIQTDDIIKIDEYVEIEGHIESFKKNLYGNSIISHKVIVDNLIEL